MILHPCCEPEIAMARAVLPADHPSATHPAHVEGPTAAEIARRLYASEHRFVALHGTVAQFGVAIVRVFENTGTRLGEALDRPGGLDAVRAELRRLVEAGIAAPFDPEHEAALKAEAARYAPAAGRVADTETAE